MYAIVDIETTGGSPSDSHITEIAVVLHNGTDIEGAYTTLVNPLKPIQKYVQGLTGITDEMVSKAPLFKDIAENIFNLLQERIFVAHNVNFDYSIVKQQLNDAGFLLKTDKLCTIRLTEQIFPKLPKYGLGTVCRELNIPHLKKHRAEGDAMATATLLSKLIASDEKGIIQKMLEKKPFQYLPPFLPPEIVDTLPQQPGVYYFHNKEKKIIYVGKAKNLQKRVRSHFTNNRASTQKMGFMEEVKDISFNTCPNEWVAAILESIEIKKYWPKFNRSQKHYEHKYAIYQWIDMEGYGRLSVDKKKKILLPIIFCPTLAEGKSILKKICSEFDIPPEYCGISKNSENRLTQADLNPKLHNENLSKAIIALNNWFESYCIFSSQNHCILIEKGTFYGMGYMLAPPNSTNEFTLSFIKPQLTPYSETYTIRLILKKYLENFRDSVIKISE